MRFFHPKDEAKILLAAHWQQIFSYVGVVKKYFLKTRNINSLRGEAELRIALREGIGAIDEAFLQQLQDKIAARLRHIYLKMDDIKKETVPFIHQHVFFEPPIESTEQAKCSYATFYLERKNQELSKAESQEINSSDDRLTQLTKKYFFYASNLRAYTFIHQIIDEQLLKKKLSWWQRLWR